MAYSELTSDGPSPLTVYNIGILDSAIANASDQLLYSKQKSAVQRPATAKTDAKTGRLLSGKRTRPASAKKFSQKETSDYNALALNGMSTCQPFYYDSSPADSCQQNDMCSTKQSSPRYRESATSKKQAQVSYRFSDRDFYSQGDGLRVPCSTPEPELALSEEERGIHSQSFENSEDNQSVPQEGEENEISVRHQLNLELPSANDSDEADEEEEIETLRLLDDLNIDLSGGTATVAISSQLKAKLASSAAPRSSYTQKSTKDELDREGQVAHSPSNSDMKGNMEREIESLLSLNRVARASTAQAHQKSLRQSDCWTNGSSPSPHCNDGDDGPRSDDHLDSSSDKEDELELLHSVNHLTENNAEDSKARTERQSPYSPGIKDQLMYCADILKTSLSPVQSVDDKETTDTLGRTSAEREEFRDLLYRWNINIDKSKQKDDVEIPLIDRRRDYDEIDEEINRRVEEIERQLASKIAESQCTIEKLESDISKTEFIIPAFCEVSNQVVTSQSDSADVKPGTAAFVLQRPDVNIIRQASKLGLKSRNVSRVFRAVTPRHDTKPVSTRDTKVNFSNVSSRINSGLKKPRIRTSKADGREKVVPAPSSARDELVIAGNTPVPTQPADGTAAAGHGKPVKQKLRSVSFQMPTKADEAVPMAKAIKTLTFAGDVVEETKHTAHQLHQRSHRTQYQLPAEVKARLSKSVKKPPPTSQSSNQKPPRAPQTINQKCSQTPQPAKQKPLLMTQSAHEKSGNESSQGKEQKVRQRVRSAPPSRKLSRERSADRKIRSEDNGIEAEKFEQKEEVVRPLEHESVVLSLYEAGNSNKAAHVLTAMELIGNEQANSQSNCEEEAEGGLSGVHQPSRPSTAHIFSKKPQGLTRRAQSAPSRRRASTQPSRTTIIPPHKYIEREDPDEIEQLTQVHAKMAHLGVGLDRTILDRALLPPASQSVNRCQQEMRKQLHTAGLLSSPDKWLKEEYKSLKKAKQRLDCQKQGVNIKKTNKVAA